MLVMILILELVRVVYLRKETCDHDKFTDDAEHINNYGSCPLVKTKNGEVKWSFDTPYCRRADSRPKCCDKSRVMRACNDPFPDANIYHKDETVIATYFDDSFNRTLEDGTKSAPCPLNLIYQTSLQEYTHMKSFDCPVTCYDCANLCRVQAMSVATADQMFDPTMQGCNAWVFCTNPDGCTNGEKTMPGLSCTLKRIPLDNPDIQKQMRAQSSGDEQVGTGPPLGLVAGGSSDFVSGFCNVRETCVNTESVRDRCELGGQECGNEQDYACGGYPYQCSDGCIPSCPC
ncbi:hypothetical protein HKI87_02g16700 [Chloropicon roscoffensis]|uniref:Uncharacterized protein n=1 Tax=Chloropicon roscoffensis TaxID=1461544 RepID=A0AAX4P1F7_9CHLO